MRTPLQEEASAGMPASAPAGPAPPPDSTAAPAGTSASPRSPRPGARALLPFALAAAGAALLYVVRPGAVTDDTYAFLDWGRDLRHGFLPLLEHRTFHPGPIAATSLISLLGTAAPTATVLLCLACLVLLAVAVWRVLELLEFPQPAPALGAILVLSSPLLSLLAQVAYVNLPFATLVLWALVLELEDRPRWAWSLLLLAGLVRPEGWAFLVAYGVLRWRRAGSPRAPRRWLGLAALSLSPMALWLGLEWLMFGSPLYSFDETRAPAVKATGSGSASGLWASLHFSLALAPMVAAVAGVFAIWRFAPRRAALTTLGATAVAAFTILVLSTSDFNVPSRHFSALVSLLYVLAAAGALAPARLLASRGRTSRRGIAAAGICGAVLVAGLAVAPTARLLNQNATTVRASHELGASLDLALARARRSLDTRGARRHTVAVEGASFESEVAWDLGVPYDVVTFQVEPRTRLMVEPSPSAYARLGLLGLTHRVRYLPPAGWRLVNATPDWEVWAPPGGSPIALG